VRIPPPEAMRDLETPRSGLPFARPVAAVARSMRPFDRALASRTSKIPSKFLDYGEAMFAPADKTCNWQK
jgi:hypothetical protein